MTRHLADHAYDPTFGETVEVIVSIHDEADQDALRRWLIECASSPVKVLDGRQFRLRLLTGLLLEMMRHPGISNVEPPADGLKEQPLEPLAIYEAVSDHHLAFLAFAGASRAIVGKPRPHDAIVLVAVETDEDWERGIHAAAERFLLRREDGAILVAQPADLQQIGSYDAMGRTIKRF